MKSNTVNPITKIINVILKIESIMKKVIIITSIITLAVYFSNAKSDTVELPICETHLPTVSDIIVDTASNIGNPIAVHPTNNEESYSTVSYTDGDFQVQIVVPIGCQLAK